MAQFSMEIMRLTGSVLRGNQHMQQKSLGNVNGFTEAEYEVLVDIALGLTDRAIAQRRSLSVRSVQNRLQQLYIKLGVYQPIGSQDDDGRFNLRARAVAVAFLRKLLNHNALERAESDLSAWLARQPHD